MRLIKMTGGLGNQMFIYAFYLSMRKRFADTRIDLSDMQHYHAHNGYELHRIFALPTDEFLINRRLKQAAELLFFKTIIERKQDLRTLHAYTREYRWPFIYFKGFYQSERYFRDVADEVRTLFTFTAPTNPQTRALAENIRTDRSSVSLHVRRGDYLTAQFRDSMGSVCGLPYYRNLITEVKQRIPAPHFYVFSDDIGWAQENLGLDGEVFVDWNTGQDSWQDMLLMSRCRHNAICNSTFSWWGAWLNAHPDKLVFAPDRWMRQRETPHILPHDWIKVPTTLP